MGRPPRTSRVRRNNGGSEAGPSQPVPESRISNDEPNTYSYSELASSTNSFSEDFSIIGKGGFGRVYKAALSGISVAIKKLFYHEQQGKQFDSEFSVLAKLKHPNLVNMLGCCNEGEDRLIVSEFMPNGSLASHLHVDCGKSVLDWSKRMNIAIGSAKGIAFLHAPCHEGKFIHRDIKPENILLGEDFEPKFADFGLARFMLYDRSRISTDSYATSGYVAPECKSKTVTQKSDVFSFGIVLLELITGKKQIFYENNKRIYLSKWAAEKLERALRTGNFNNLVDVKLRKKYDKEEMSRMIYCAAASVYKLEKKRPEMSQDNYFSLGPISDSGRTPPLPFPLGGQQELLLHCDYHDFGEDKIVFPKYKGWRRLVDKFAPRYGTFWRRMGIYDFVYLTCHEIRLCESVLAGALTFWSSYSNSLILPLGPMSITLRDVVALTGLPILGLDVTSRIHTKAFSHMKVLKVQEVGTYVCMINKMLTVEEVDDEDHVNFLWLLLCQFIFEPLGGRPTPDVFMLAKALASGTMLGLGPMLLANTYQRLSMTFTEKPLAKVRGGMWLFQLWLFSYFPHLATEQIDYSMGRVGFDKCYSYSDMELCEVVRRLRQMVPGSINMFLFDEPRTSFLPDWATTYISAATTAEVEGWYLFVTTKHLYHGISKNRNPKAPARCMVLYAPCLWARQFGFYQATPDSLPFVPYGQQHDATDDEIEASIQNFDIGRGR